MDDTLCDKQILSLRDKRTLLVVAIFLFQDCSIFFYLIRPARSIIDCLATHFPLSMKIRDDTSITKK